MQCPKCKTRLTPFFIRQVFKNGKVELECPNPLCHKLNIVSKEFYFTLKKEVLLQNSIEKRLKLTSKLPGEANVIFVSLERCGISWIVRIISKIHEIMFGKPIEYQPEISRVISTRKRFDLPQGWYNVYSVDPLQLIERGYDKVVSIQRPKEIMYRILAMYYQPELTYEECKYQHPNYFKKIDKYYDIVYGNMEELEKKYSTYKNFFLSDFNNYTYTTFNELLDFLNFPEDGRPTLFPVNPPERNWQAYSTTLSREEKIGAKLRKMQEKYGVNPILEYDLQLKMKKAKKQVNPTPKRKLPHINKFEQKIQDGRKFRMYIEDLPDALEKEERYKILVITPIGHGIGAHLGEKMAEAFTQLNHSVELLTFKQLRRKHYHLREDPVSLIEILNEFYKNPLHPKNKPDFIFINQVRMRIRNDTDIPIMYFHTGWYSELGILGENIVNYFRQDQLLEAYDYGNRVNRVLYHAVDPNIYYPKEKTYKGVYGIGYRRSWEEWDNIVGDMKPMVDLMHKEVEEFKELGFHYFDTPVDDHKYREIIRKLEAFNPIIGYGEYVSRRMLEAMASKTLVVYRLDFLINEDGSRDYSIHKGILEGMGYYANKHYIQAESMGDIKEKWDMFTEMEKDRMKERAYEITLKRHTHKNRAKQVIKDFEEGIWRGGINEF